MRHSFSRVSSLSVVSALVLLAGLSTGCRNKGFLPAPGTMNQQQARAVVHDPYPLTDIGPNDQASRPPSYQQPLPGPVRDRLSADAMPWLGR
nr:membrane or secreted protein [Rhodopirellula sp. JC740]